MDLSIARLRRRPYLIGVALIAALIGVALGRYLSERGWAWIADVAFAALMTVVIIGRWRRRLGPDL